MQDGGRSGAGCFEIELLTDAAKVTNIAVLRKSRHGQKSDMFCHVHQ